MNPLRVITTMNNDSSLMPKCKVRQVEKLLSGKSERALLFLSVTELTMHRYWRGHLCQSLRRRAHCIMKGNLLYFSYIEKERRSCFLLLRTMSYRHINRKESDRKNISGTSDLENSRGYMVQTVTTRNFQELVQNATVPVVLDFWAPWCGPCRIFSDVVEKFAENYGDKVIVGKVNIDEEPSLAEKFRVMSIPTVLIFKNGTLADTLVGSRPLESLMQSVDVHLD